MTIKTIILVQLCYDEHIKAFRLKGQGFPFSEWNNNHFFITISYINREEVMASKIFVRERRKIEKGEKKPRFRILGVNGNDLKIYVKHIRKRELEQLADASGAEVVYLKVEKKDKDK